MRLDLSVICVSLPHSVPVICSPVCITVGRFYGPYVSGWFQIPKIGISLLLNNKNNSSGLGSLADSLMKIFIISSTYMLV